MDDSSYAHYTGYLLQHVAEVLGKQSDQMLQERIGIGYSQVKILMVLQANPEIKQNQIAKRLGQTEASISRQIKLLVNKSMLRASKNTKNKRERTVSLTLKGERVVQEAMTILSYYHLPLFEGMSSDQKSHIVESLKFIHQKSCGGSRIGACDHPLSF